MTGEAMVTDYPLVDQAVITRRALTESVLSRFRRRRRLRLRHGSTAAASGGGGEGGEKAESGDGAHLRTPARPINRSPRVHARTYVRTKLRAPTLRAGHAESGSAEFHADA